MARIIHTESITDPALLSPNDREWVYNGLDCCVTFEILEEIETLLDEDTRRTYELSKSLQAPILDMTMRGLRVDLVRRIEVLKKFKEQIEFISAQLNRILKEGLDLELNWRSPHQLKRLFYDILKLPVQKKRTANGKFAPTTDREALEKLEEHHYAMPICIRLLLLRDLDKKRSWLETGLDPDNRMRTNYNISGTVTGRLASSMSDYGTGGNMQNVDRLLRSVFVPDKGMKFANIDLEQADARNVGAICWNLFVEHEGESFAGTYLNACESGDLHTTVCTMAYRDLQWGTDPWANRTLADGIAYRELSYRDLAKKLGHGTNYYGQPPTMAKHSKVPRQQIETFQGKYFSAFPVIGSRLTDIGANLKPNWHNWVKRQLRDSQTITTQFGRRRLFFSDPRADSTVREAIAFEPQSMTADELNIAMLQVWRSNTVQLLAQVHDSLLLQYPEEQENELISQLKTLFRAPLILKKDREFVVPCEVKVGWNWGDSSSDNPHGLSKFRGTETRKRPGDLWQGMSR